MNKLRDRVIALAGIFQAVQNVRDTAAKGVKITPAIESSINSLLKIGTNSAEDIYGGMACIQEGLHGLCKQLSTGSTHRDVELAKYVVSLLYLERKLSKNAELMQRLQDGIQSAVEKAEYFSPTHTNVIAHLAGLYQETISKLMPKIMVSGEPEILNNPDNANMIRTMLLAGIRSAMLWHQCGGRQMQLLFKRKKIIQTASWLIKSTRESLSDQN